MSAGKAMVPQECLTARPLPRFGRSMLEIPLGFAVDDIGMRSGSRDLGRLHRRDSNHVKGPELLVCIHRSRLLGTQMER